MELTNSIRKMVVSLNDAKHRKINRLFKAEGTKCVLDTINGFHTKYIIATQNWINKHEPDRFDCELIKVSPREMERISSLSTATEVVAVYNIPEQEINIDECSSQLCLALDNVQDPGNLGTIIRTADWFGIKNIICSRTTVDVYNPKVVQATMGAISRVAVHYCDLPELLPRLTCRDKFGTFLNGDNIYESSLPDRGIIVMGNEGTGVSDSVKAHITRRLFIPPYPPHGAETSESLNVAIATAVVLSEFRRRAKK